MQFPDEETSVFLVKLWEILKQFIVIVRFISSLLQNLQDFCFSFLKEFFLVLDITILTITCFNMHGVTIKGWDIKKLDTVV